MLTLGIDTSNYATSLAVFDTKAEEVVCACKRFLPVKEGALGLRQSDAVFHHTAALPEMLDELSRKSDLTQIKAVGVSKAPRPVDGSYMPCFLTGVAAAKAFSLAGGIPLIETTHQQGHMAAALFAAGGKSFFEQKTLVFHVSGGTTDLLLCENGNVLETLATSTDLYAGQAVDRVGVKLGFKFPAGEYVSALAEECTDEPKAKASVKNGCCSLSGLENQCDALMKSGSEPKYVAKFCLYCIAETALRMIKTALVNYPKAPVICAGGVMSSSVIKKYMQKRMNGILFVPPQYASDNAIGTAILAAREVGAWQTL
ncbi:MAG: glycoprotease [Clostridia bacterium]|nr:glycoprotease [Clostridia bacterium]NLS85881.1 glycoprotease [Oscillospiraceae bacterium]